VSADPATDRRALTEQQYADSGNLVARQSIYAFQRPISDIWGGSLELAALRGDETILDIGCGNGLCLGVLRARGHRGLVCGADLSPGMLRSARAAAGAGPLLVSDAQAISFADDTFDVTIAMHMLYHVPDRALAIAELRRVLRPDGVALVVTNSEAHFHELDDLIVECAAAATGVTRLPMRSYIHFTAESGAPELAAQFSSVETRDFVSQLVLDQVDPALDYVRSMSSFVADTEGQLEGVLEEISRRIAAVIESEGAFRVTTSVRCFACS
jgi:ubiquinone/menaquinone biosynthesis C-methylase UbiE